MQGTPAFRFFSKRTQFMAQILVISSINGEIILTEFHFTNIDDTVGSVNNHIYLRTIFLFLLFQGLASVCTPLIPSACLICGR